MGQSISRLSKGMLRTNDWEKAYSLTELALLKTDGMNKVLCQTWERIDTRASTTPEKTTTVAQALSLLQCTK